MFSRHPHQMIFLPQAWYPLIYPPIAASANFTNSKFGLVFPRTKFLQRLHIAPRLIPKPYLSISSSFGLIQMSSDEFWAHIHTPPPGLQSDLPAIYSPNTPTLHAFLHFCRYTLSSSCACDKLLCILQNPAQMSFFLIQDFISYLFLFTRPFWCTSWS